MYNTPPPLRARACLGLLMATALLSASPVAAQLSNAEKDRARALIVEGRDKLSAGNPRGALVAFEEAHRIMHVPTTGFELAQARESLGMLIEAREVLVEVTRMQVDPAAPEIFKERKVQAAETLKTIETRIPSVRLQITGAVLTSVEVKIDGARLAVSEIGTTRELNPGRHEIVVSAPKHITEQIRVKLEDGDTRHLEVPIELVPRKAEVTWGIDDVSDTKEHKRAATESIPTWAWVSSGLALALFSGAGAFRVDQAYIEGKQFGICGGDVKSTCPPANQYLPDQDNNRKNLDSYLFTGLGIAGMTALGVSIVGFVSRSKVDGREPKAEATTSWVPWISPTALGGAFGCRF